MAGLHLKEKNAVEKPKRRSVVSKGAMSVEAEKELELNIADNVTQVPDCEIDAVLYTISGVWVLRSASCELCSVGGTLGGFGSACACFCFAAEILQQHLVSMKC